MIFIIVFKWKKNKDSTLNVTLCAKRCCISFLYLHICLSSFLLSPFLAKMRPRVRFKTCRSVRRFLKLCHSVSIRGLQSPSSAARSVWASGAQGMTDTHKLMVTVVPTCVLFNCSWRKSYTVRLEDLLFESVSMPMTTLRHCRCETDDTVTSLVIDNRTYISFSW